jgi:hypothetical protein
MKTILTFLMLLMCQVASGQIAAVDVLRHEEELRLQQEANALQAQRNYLLYMQRWQQQAAPIAAPQPVPAAPVPQATTGSGRPLVITPRVYIPETPPEVLERVKRLEADASRSSSALYNKTNELRKLDDRYHSLRRSVMQLKELIEKDAGKEELLRALETILK